MESPARNEFINLFSRYCENKLNEIKGDIRQSKNILNNHNVYYKDDIYGPLIALNLNLKWFENNDNIKKLSDLVANTWVSNNEIDINDLNDKFINLIKQSVQIGINNKLIKFLVLAKKGELKKCNYQYQKGIYKDKICNKTSLCGKCYIHI